MASPAARSFGFAQELTATQRRLFPAVFARCFPLLFHPRGPENARIPAAIKGFSAVPYVEKQRYQRDRRL
jgi:hypothetical protein